jgi:putative spermidine/putrescine transport system substrate-binding protein
MKRKLEVMLTVLLLLAFGLWGGGCGQRKPETAQPVASQQLVVASYGGALDEVLKKYVVSEFEKKYNVKVVLDPSVEFARLVAEKGKPSIDLAFLDDARVIEGGKIEGLLEKLDLSKLTNAKDLYPQAIDRNGFGVAWVFGSYGIVYRTDKVSPPPKSWADLWKPEFKHKVAINDLVSNGGVQFFVQAAQLRGGDERNIEPAFEMIKALAPNLLTISQTTAQMTDMLTRGDVWIAPWWDGRALNLQAKGVPVGFVRPIEGAFATVVEFSIPKGTPKVDLAYKFIDMALSPEAQLGFAKEMFYGPVNRTVVLPDDLAAKVVYGETEVKKLKYVDWDYISTVRSQWIERWNKEIVPLIK